MKLTIIDPQNDYRLLEWCQTRAIATQKLPFNFFSIINFGLRLDHLCPDTNLLKYLAENKITGKDDSYKFDYGYATQIVTNEKTFIDFMTLMDSVVKNDETILMSNYTSSFVMPILDSLLKFIQERYGIYAFIVNTLDDIDPLSSSEFGTLEQQMCFSTDLARYAKLTNKPIELATQKEIEEDLMSLQASQYQDYGA